jgi:hypothetical protein
LTYDNLLDEADKENIYVIENAKFQSKASGLINNDVIGINKNVRSSTQRTCILAEELGHYYTSSGNILDQSSAANRKQERTARVWAYNRLIGLSGIVDSYKAGCRNLYEIAEHLEVTEIFLSDALACYKEKYGLYAQVDNYVIYFEPLGVAELI